MRSVVRTVVFGLAFQAALGCAAASSTEGAEGAARPAHARLTEAEIQASHAANVEQLIRAERPTWLTSRGAMGMRPGDEPDTYVDAAALVVYVDDVRRGGASELSQLSLAGVTLIEFYDPPSATLRWGTGHPRGAIVITTRGLQ